MVVTVLAVREYEGWILGLAIVAAYIGILVELKNIAEKLEQAEYVLEEHPVRISDGRYAAGAAILTAAGLLIGYTCFGSYHMAWTTAKETQDSASEEIKAHLLSLGFPEEILHDLKEEDILACKNARQILLNQSDDLLRDGDERLQLDGVAVELEQEGQWKVIHHFLWNGNSGFRGTEAVQINPAYQELNGGWTAQENLPARSFTIRMGLLTPQSMRLYKMKHTIPTRIFHFTEASSMPAFLQNFPCHIAGKTAADTWLTKSRQRKVTGGLIPGSITPIKRPSGSTQ